MAIRYPDAASGPTRVDGPACFLAKVKPAIDALERLAERREGRISEALWAVAAAKAGLEP